ncbi:MAG TPA: fumarylacetoacetate hydrolase family protein [Acidimicrobiia bacterium]|nr:fumarylacetoacetate hydrolase family protein [Acidimicrobiia bacterium]
MPTAAEWAGALLEAGRSRRPIDPPSETDPNLTVDDAYRIQQEYVKLLMGSEGKVVGYKLGLTSRPMQEMMGVDQPDYGPVLSNMVFDDGAEVALSDYIQPRVEAEIALVLEAPLRGPGISALQAARAVGGAVAAIEMVDSRITDWRIKLVDTISDLASSAATVLGSRLVPLAGWDVRLCGMVVMKNGITADSGAGAAALGNPLVALAWLANTLAPYDVTLEPGWFVMTGALHRAFPVAPGDVVRAEFDRLGPVTVRFI